MLGTLGYMSPEQLSGEAADARSDIFAFGAILYEMLAGHRAFRGDSATDTMAAILTRDPPELSLTNQNVPPGLDHIVRHCLEKDPEQRLHSAHDVAFALAEISGGSTASGVAALPQARGRRRPWLRVAAGLAAAAALTAGGFLAGARSHPEGPPTFRQLTFRRGLVSSARFGPDGQTVLYSAAWEEGPDELYQARVGLPESLPLKVPGGEAVAGVTASGDMAVLLRAAPAPILARVPITGGAPREIAENVTAADISPKGDAFAVVRRAGGVSRLEYPIGKTLHETGGGISALRISPDGERVAFFDHPLVDNDRGVLVVAERSGSKKTLTREWSSVGGLAWSPSGDEIWFSAADRGSNLLVRTVSLSGATRPVLSGPGRLFLRDIAADGRLLVEERTVRRALMCKPPDQEQERDLSWLDHSTVAAISSNGSLLLLSETGEGGGENSGIYVRKTDGSAAVRLGDGLTDNFSTDERWVDEPDVGPGTQGRSSAGRRRRAADAFRTSGSECAARSSSATDGASCSPAPVPASRCACSSPRPKARRSSTSARTRSGLPAPFRRTARCSSRWTATAGPRSIRSTEARCAPVPAYVAGEWPAGWSADGRFLYFFSTGQVPLRVWRVDLAGGRRELWRVITPAEATGTRGFDMFTVSADGRSYAYSYSRTHSTLYVVEAR